MKRHRRELTLAIALAALLAAVAVAAPAFFTAGNLWNLLVDNLPALVAAIGMTLVLLAGQIDISVGSQFAVCGAVAGVLAKAGLPLPLVVVATLAAGAGLGALNGILVAVARVPAIIVTLATMVGVRGALRWLSGGYWIQDLPASFQWFGLGQVAGQRLFLALALAVVTLTAAALRWTSAGRSLLAIGCNPEAARLAGIRPRRVIATVFVLMGAFTALASLLNFPRYPSIEVEAGVGLELQVIACVVIGGTKLSGGSGTIAGTVLGVALLATLGSALVFLGVDPAWERAVQGAILLAAVGLDTATARRTHAGAHHA